jgi:hypothetical protein
MSQFNDRRRTTLMLAAAGLSALALGTAPRRIVAASPALLDPNDPSAKALGYVSDATSLDPEKNPPFKPGSHCANCVQYTGAQGSASGPCSLFPGKLVAANGWCRVWAAKS